MWIQQSSQQGCVVLTLAGRLDLAAAPQVQRAILKHLAEQPPAIICDLSQVEAIDPLCAAVFTSIRHPALGWPGTALAVSVPVSGNDEPCSASYRGSPPIASDHAMIGVAA
jgi:ABC-type transporter Mla MlaB component